MARSREDAISVMEEASVLAASFAKEAVKGFFSQALEGWRRKLPRPVPVRRWYRAVIRHPDVFVWMSMPLHYGFRLYRKKDERKAILRVGVLFFTFSIRV